MTTIQIPKPITIILLFIWLSFNLCYSQKEYNNWFFGDKAGLNFNSGMSVPVVTGQMTTQEGSAAISDSLGNLLFYTDGVKVWNKNHSIMPNGTGLTGNFSSTQSALILKKPGAANKYYIFTVDCQISNFGLRYSEVDMSLDNGLGDVSVKNTLVYAPCDEKLCYAYHCNGNDVWIVTHERGTTSFRSYLLTQSGISSVPVISNTGVDALTGVGYLKISPDGRKLLSTEHTALQTQLCDFDNSTGIVSNAFILPQFSMNDGSYGVEYSPDGSKMYVSCPHNPSKIFQFDMCAGDNKDIALTGTVIGSSSASWIGALQRAPDGKIYLARYMESTLAVINNPNQAGAACNYIDYGVSLNGKFGRLGLPNNIYSDRMLTPPSMTLQQDCDTLQFFSPDYSSSNCNSSFDPLMNVVWNFGDTAAGVSNFSTDPNPVHIYTGVGKFIVTMVLKFKCRTDTLIQEVFISKPSVQVSTIPPGCANNDGAATVTASGHVPVISYTWLPGGQTTTTVNGLSSGTYSVVVCDSNGCKQTITAVISGVNSSLGILQADTTITAGESIVLHASGGVDYLWTPSSGLSCVTCENTIATPGESTTYCVTATDSNNCSQTRCVKVQVDPGMSFIPNSFTPNGDNLNEIFIPVVPEGRDYVFQIFNRWGAMIFESTNAAYGWDGTYRGGKCQQDIYAYTLSYTDQKENKRRRYNGKILLIR